MMDDYVNKWLLKADNDLKAATSLLKMPSGEVVTEAVCFHSQQAAEKYLKAFLVTREIDFGKTHNLEFLVELCASQDRDFRKLEVGNLTSYAVEVRYPDEFYTPSLSEARESVRLARRVKQFVLKKLKIKR
jgi:HEPN domain-containing protein